MGGDKKKSKSSDLKPGQQAGGFDAGPKMLPLSYFEGHDTDEQKMELCYAAFEEMLETHDPVSTGFGYPLMVRKLIREINEVFEGNTEAKQAFAWRLGKHPWFRENEQMVKWQSSRNLIQVSKVSPEAKAMWAEKNGGKGKGKGKNKGDSDHDASAGNAWS